MCRYEHNLKFNLIFHFHFRGIDFHQLVLSCYCSSGSLCRTVSCYFWKALSDHFCSMYIQKIITFLLYKMFLLQNVLFLDINCQKQKQRQWSSRYWRVAKTERMGGRTSMLIRWWVFFKISLRNFPSGLIRTLTNNWKLMAFVCNLFLSAEGCVEVLELTIVGWILNFEESCSITSSFYTTHEES